MGRLKTNPDEAFDFYRSLGVGRSHKLVAKHFGVALRTIASYASKFNWDQRLNDEGLSSPYGRLARDYAEQLLQELLESLKTGGIVVRSATDAVKLGEFLMKLIDKGVRPEEERSVAKVIKAHADRFGVAS